jgi:hypothetical protein
MLLLPRDDLRLDMLSRSSCFASPSGNDLLVKSSLARLRADDKRMCVDALAAGSSVRRKGWFSAQLTARGLPRSSIAGGVCCEGDRKGEAGWAL